MTPELEAVFSTPAFGIALSVGAYAVGCWVNKKLKTPLANPMLIAVVLIIAFLVATGIPVDDYSQGGDILNFLLFPATAAIGLSIYDNIDILKKHLLPVLGGCLAGAVTSVASVFVLCRAFSLGQTVTASLLPKSVTTAIAVPISTQYGGIAPVTIVALMVAGMMGAVLAPTLSRVLRLSDSKIATGLAIGCSSHGAGTSTAVRMDETVGAMSGLAIGVCGLWTVVLSLFFRFLL